MLPFARDVRAGLGQSGQKYLSCEYFYDEVGSALFEVITLLPEYGLTRADARLVRRLATELGGYLHAPAVVAELGSGTGTKTRFVLEALAAGGPIAYYPIDLSRSALAHCARELAAFAEVHPIEETYLNGLRQAVCRRRSGQAMLVLFLGSTIGNFERAAAQDFLRDIRACLMPGDALLLGADLIKPLPGMLLAYDDPAGVTAAFNLNLLARINRELDADFVLKRFAHEARWNPYQRRVEMHLRSLAPQTAFIRAAGLECEFLEDETIWTESCHKFQAGEIGEMAAAAGFECAAQWTDEDWPFAESLLIA
ncbi:MAG TPA: L-histidine N(alpha)-methyltransferase [Bryobacteraceae bacterium]|nr:L-histidine N(alpha)-methyltransferase [Bryobacteraceae bacterium]